MRTRLKNLMSKKTRERTEAIEASITLVLMMKCHVSPIAKCAFSRSTNAVKTEISALVNNGRWGRNKRRVRLICRMKSRTRGAECIFFRRGDTRLCSVNRFISRRVCGLERNIKQSRYAVALSLNVVSELLYGRNGGENGFEFDLTLRSGVLIYVNLAAT